MEIKGALTMVNKPVQQYRVLQDIPREFFKLLPAGCKIRQGEVCTWFEWNNVYLFEARESYRPYIERKYVEMWNKYFEPVK